MNWFRLHFIKLSLVISVTGCSIRSDESNTIRYVDIEANVENLQQIDLSSFSDDIRYVPLEADPDHFFRSIMYMDFSDRFILLTDGRYCSLYDNNGLFVRQIGENGRGPGEYQGINSVSVFNDNIYVHDYYTDDLIEYKTDGTFIRRYRSGFTAEDNYIFPDAYMLNDSLILGNIENRSGQEEYKALVINRQGVVKSSFKNYIKFDLASGVKSIRVPGRAFYYSFGNEVYFKELLNDTLFRLTRDYKLIPECIFNFGKYEEPLSKRGERWSDIDLTSYIFLLDLFPIQDKYILNCQFSKYFPAKRLTPAKAVLPDGRELILQYHANIGTSLTGIYDFKTKDLIFAEPLTTDNPLDHSGFFNDIDAGPRFFPMEQVNDSTLVMWMEAKQLKDHVASNEFRNRVPKFPERKKRLEILADSLTESDNPVMMFVTFK